MPFKQHDSFPPPPNSDVKLWRYMDFVKLFALFRTSKLYFPSAYQLLTQDPFEGSYTAYHSTYQLTGTVGEGATNELSMTERNVPPEGWPPEQWHLIQELDKKQRQEMRRYVFINSWHMNSHESIAMWKLYDVSGSGMAIVSNFDRLKHSLAGAKERFFLGMVQYIDYKNTPTWLGNALDPFMHKTIELSHEHEVRAVVWTFHQIFTDFMLSIRRKQERKYEDPPLGILLECNLDTLIDYVVVSPMAPDWIFDLLKSYCEENLGKEKALELSFRSAFLVAKVARRARNWNCMGRLST